MWKYHGQKRPDFACNLRIDQESVWDYPRPPVAAPDSRLVEVRDGDAVIARSTKTVRILETASPPTFYIPPDDVQCSLLTRGAGSSICEWKGQAHYWGLASAPNARPVAWTYGSPNAEFELLKNYASFYPGRIACFVDGERVRAQPGGFYGGWITRDVVGPFKGEPGTGHW